MRADFESYLNLPKPPSTAMDYIQLLNNIQSIPVLRGVGNVVTGNHVAKCLEVKLVTKSTNQGEKTEGLLNCNNAQKKQSK